MTIVEKYLIEIQNVDVLYHAGSMLTKTLKPRKSPIGKVGGKEYSKDWSYKAIYAAAKRTGAIPFGLERVNLMWIDTYTEEEVNRFKYSCWLKQNKAKGILEMWYWNYTPRKPFYLYTVDRKDFKRVRQIDKTAIVEQWYSTKEITPIEVEKIFPKDVKQNWRRVSKKVWEAKKQKYKDKGMYR